MDFIEWDSLKCEKFSKLSYFFNKSVNQDDGELIFFWKTDFPTSCQCSSQIVNVFFLLYSLDSFNKLPSLEAKKNFKHCCKTIWETWMVTIFPYSIFV